MADGNQKPLTMAYIEDAVAGWLHLWYLILVRMNLLFVILES